MSLISLFCTFSHFFLRLKVKPGKETVKFLAIFDHRLAAPLLMFLSQSSKVEDCRYNCL